LVGNQQPQIAVDVCNLIPNVWICCASPGFGCDPTANTLTTTVLDATKLTRLTATFAQTRLAIVHPHSEFETNRGNKVLIELASGGEPWELIQQPSNQLPPYWGLVVPECGGLVVSSLRPLGPMLAAVTGDHSDEITYFDSGGVAPVPNLPGAQSARH
jgi:hypothetical protein